MPENRPPSEHLPSPLIGAERRELLLREAVRQGLLDPEETPLAAFLDLDAVTGTVAALHAAFPAALDVRHAFAAKANPLGPVLRRLRALGMGCARASSRRPWPRASRRS